MIKYQFTKTGVIAREAGQRQRLANTIAVTESPEDAQSISWD